MLRPNLAARILDGEQRITRIVNNYSKISFNFGPHCCPGRQSTRRKSISGLIDADRKSQKQFSGHGSAIAQAYNHIILPLANSRDKQTQIRWGYEDFVSRFGRQPEGMWLPETAVDIESLDLMAQAGLSYAILAPHQAKAIRPLGSGTTWTGCQRLESRSRAGLSVQNARRQIDQSLLLRWPDFAGRRLRKAAEQRRAIRRPADRRPSPMHATGPQLMHIATDGETYGHHHRHGEMALAYAIDHIETNEVCQDHELRRISRNSSRPPGKSQIHENTAWSCMHGVERWRSNCGCNVGRVGWNQEWRKPLRDALDWLRDWITPHFEKLGSMLLNDPVGGARRLYQGRSRSLARSPRSNSAKPTSAAS